METLLKKQSWQEISQDLSQKFSQRAAESDASGEFVFENYRELKENRFFSAMIPKELGGGGMSHAEMCDNIRTFGKSCGSTALALSMHQHLIATSVWKYQQDGSNEEMLRNVAENELILISTGARDWLESNGEMEKTEGGYLFSATKFFASQSAIGDIVVTSSVYDNHNNPKVLHFAVPTSAHGIKILDDWDVMGMRSTGSQTIVFDKVFIPDSAITLERDQGEFHPVWNVVLTVAMPLIMSAYIGLAERAREIAMHKGKDYKRNQGHINYITGKLHNTYLAARVQWERIVKLANDLSFKPDTRLTVDILSLKTNLSETVIDIVGQSMDALGGQSFYKKKEVERLFRDVQASKFHPLPKWDQYQFTGGYLLNETINL